MSRNRDRDRKPQRPSAPSAIEEARNELFSHIHRCGVMRADEQNQLEWMRETVEFLGERYPALTEAQMEELSDIGLRFCRPVIANAPQESETETETAAA